MNKNLFFTQYRVERRFFMSRNKVEICNVNTANIKVLNNNEMVELFKKYKAGDLKAKEELINGNLKFKRFIKY